MLPLLVLRRTPLYKDNLGTNLAFCRRTGFLFDSFIFHRQLTRSNRLRFLFCRRLRGEVEDVIEFAVGGANVRGRVTSVHTPSAVEIIRSAGGAVGKDAV